MSEDAVFEALKYRIVVNEDGDKFYYNSKDEYHREDGPAVERANSGKAWCINGKLHCEDGPAVEYASGDKHWFINNEELTEEQFLQWRKDNNKE